MSKKKRTIRSTNSEPQESSESRTTCPECKGEGTVYGCYDANYNGRFYLILGACPICSREGTIPEEK